MNSALRPVTDIWPQTSRCGRFKAEFNGRLRIGVGATGDGTRSSSTFSNRTNVEFPLPLELGWNASQSSCRDGGRAEAGIQRSSGLPGPLFSVPPRTPWKVSGRPRWQEVLNRGPGNDQPVSTESCRKGRFWRVMGWLCNGFGESPRETGGVRGTLALAGNFGQECYSPGRRGPRGRPVARRRR